MVYFKTFPLQELQAATFSMTQPQANFWIHLLSPVLRKMLKRLKELPGQQPKIGTVIKGLPLMFCLTVQNEAFNGN